MNFRPIEFPDSIDLSFHEILQQNSLMGRKSMYDLNLDMLAASSRYHPDGRPKDIHAQHRLAHLSALREGRRATWIARIRRFARAIGLAGPQGSAPSSDAPAPTLHEMAR
ncbi:hypothetical protein L0V05_02455 [Tabrizicola sp. J26]|nr:hypothetical protein [Tabrizicola rongguiensis]